MSNWGYVTELAERLPGAVLGEAQQGSPAYFIGKHAFARFRKDDAGREILQTWTGDMGTEAALAGRRDVFPVVNTLGFRVTTWAYLDALEDREAAELILDSYQIRGPVGRRSMDMSRYLPS